MEMERGREEEGKRKKKKKKSKKKEMIVPACYSSTFEAKTK
jgi:hypothetical protein